MGAYFGASLCAVDVNGDGLEDLFVGAPFYNQSLGDEGAVFFYLRKKEVKLYIIFYTYLKFYNKKLWCMLYYSRK